MRKLKKPIVILLLVCFFSLNFSVYKPKKVDAFVVTGTALTYLILTALAVATGGVIAYNNSQGNGIGDIINSYRNGGSTALDDDDFANWITDTYAPNIPELNQYLENGGNDPEEPQRTPNAVEQAIITSMLTKQGYEMGSDLYNNLYDYYAAQGIESQIPDIIDGKLYYNLGSLISGSGLFMFSSSGSSKITWAIDSVGSTQKTFEVYNNNKLIGYYIVNILNVGTSFTTNQALSKFVTVNNDVVLNNYTKWNSPYVYLKHMGNDVYSLLSSSGTILASNFQVFPDDPYVPTTDLPPFIAPQPVLPEKLDYLPNFYNIDMSAFNGLGYNQNQIMDILNGNMTVSQSEMDKITKAAQDTYLNYLENPVSTPGTPLDPEIDPTTGQPVYGDNFVTDPEITPNIPPDELTGLGSILGWLKSLWNVLKFMPLNIFNYFKDFFKPVIEFAQKFWQQMEIWAHDNLYVHWVTLQNLLIDNMGQFVGFLQGLPDFLLNAPGLIGTWWTTQGLPDLQILFDPLINPGASVPPDVVAPPTWSDFYTPIKTALDYKFPWLFPEFEKLNGFYEEPFEDIYANIKIGSVQGTYKIIDMSFINDNKEQVKQVIRDFLMILLWLYQISMGYKLLRGSDLLKSSITGVSGK